MRRPCSLGVGIVRRTRVSLRPDATEPEPGRSQRASEEQEARRLRGFAFTFSAFAFLAFTFLTLLAAGELVALAGVADERLEVHLRVVDGQ